MKTVQLEHTEVVGGSGRDAAELLWQTYANELMKFATSLVGPHDAADLVSVAFIGVIQSRNWGSVINQRAYLYRSVLNAANSTRRSTARRETREQRVSAQAATETSSLELADEELLSALSALSERQRAVVYLTYWMDYSPAQIADLLDLSEGSVKKHLDRGRTHLRTTLGAHS